MGGRKDGGKGGGECDVDDHRFSAVSKLLGGLALVAMIVGIGMGKYECLRFTRFGLSVS